MNPKFFIERSNKNGTYSVIWRGKDYSKALKFLESIKSRLPHGVWCYEWIHTDAGYAPMAWIN